MGLTPVDSEMGFKSEQEMKRVAAEALPNAFGLHGENVLSEFDYGKGRTDLVLVNISDDYWTHRIDRLDLSTPISKDQHLISFLQIHGRGAVTKEFFLNSGAQPERKKRDSLAWLLQNDFIMELPSGKVRTARNLRRHVTTTLAVELKLGNWRKAIQQASMGRSFAEYRYVAIAEEHLNPAYNNLAEFKSNNIGLISIDTDGTTTVHWVPDRGDPYSDLYQWKLNERSISKITS